ncbi:MAG: adenylate cyclase [Pseudobdellovibrio sp.]|nr:adenylate cyclase [Pseudobdellovibrio sp.]
MHGISDYKFRLRSGTHLKNNLVLVEVDNRTLEQFSEFGRWPWQRDPQAFLIYSLLKYNPSVLVLDIIYSEAEGVRIPVELESDLRRMGRADLADRYSPDAKLVKIINNYSKKIVLAGGAEGLCFSDCDKAEPSPELLRWAGDFKPSSPFIENPLLNLSEYNSVASHFGFSVAQAGRDGVLRRVFLYYNYGTHSFPSLAVSAAKAINPNVEFSAAGPQLNFRDNIGKDHALSAAEILMAEQDSESGKRLKKTIAQRLENRIVVLGVTASAAGDFHATPAGLLSGPEILTTTIDNLLSNDFFQLPSHLLTTILILIVLLFLALIEKLKESSTSLRLMVLFLVMFGLMAAADAICFSRYINLPSLWLYLLLLVSVFITLYQKYSIAEAQKAFIKSAFSKYVSPAYVNELVKNPEKLKVGGVKKDLTIMFSDIRGFTSFSEKMDAKILGEFLNEYLDAMTEIVFASRGTLDKYIGDAVMAFWGDPLDATDHASCACESAIKMMIWIRQKQDYFLQKYGVDLQVGIGIHTGPVSVGNLGSSKSLGYTVIGDVVNFTSRLEGATKEYGVSILSTEETIKEIKKSGRPVPPFRELDYLGVKGKKEPVKIVQIFETQPAPQILPNFNRAREQYLLRNWSEAILLFEKCGDDKPSRIFIERCRHFQTNPPPDNWDGSWKLTNK